MTSDSRHFVLSVAATLPCRRLGLHVCREFSVLPDRVDKTRQCRRRLPELAGEYLGPLGARRMSGSSGLLPLILAPLLAQK